MPNIIRIRIRSKKQYSLTSARHNSNSAQESHPPPLHHNSQAGTVLHVVGRQGRTAPLPRDPLLRRRHRALLPRISRLSVRS